MIEQLGIKTTIQKCFTYCLFFLILSIQNPLNSQEIIISKTALENPTICNQFDISLDIIGDPPSSPKEVVLIIDRSGSMDDGPYPEPIDYAKEAAINFVEEIFLPENNPTGLNKVAVVSYSTFASLDIGLTNSFGKQDILNVINNILTGGWTNIEDGLLKADDELTNNGSFDCITSRSIILLTDGVATFRNGSNTNCDSTTENTDCQLAAIEAGINAQTTLVGGEEFKQNIFTIGLVGALWGIEQEIALNTLDQIQNKGAYWTEDNADLSEIYSLILDQLVSAAQQLPGEALVTDTVTSGFEIINGSLVTSKGNASISGQIISWYVSDVLEETITLNYSIQPNTFDVCGEQEAGISIMNYIDSECNEQILQFENPGFCVPCSELLATINYENCDQIIYFSSELIQGNCSPVSGDYLWEFYLNDLLVGTSISPTGNYEYTGSNPFIGEFKAELTFTGTYGNGCILPDVTTNTTILIESFLELSAEVEPQVLCFGESTASIDLTVINGNPPFTYLWSNGATTEDLNNVPAGLYNVQVTDNYGCFAEISEEILVTEPDALVSTIISETGIVCEGLGSIIIESEGGTPPYIYSIDGANNQDNGIFSNLTEGVHVITIQDANLCINEIEIFTVNKCISLIKEGVFNDEDKDGCTAVGETISYTFTVTNLGNVLLSNITVADPLVTVDGEPLTNLAIGISDSETFTATYIITQEDINFGVVLNQATVFGTGSDQSIVFDISDDNSEFEDDPTITSLCLISEIGLIKEVILLDENGNNCADLGEQLHYTFKVKNKGNRKLQNIQVIDPLVMVQGDPISLNPSEENTSAYTATYTINQQDIDTGIIVNQATVEATTPDGELVSDLSDFENYLSDKPTVFSGFCPVIISIDLPSISLEKIGFWNDENGNLSTDAGETISYCFKITNTGESKLYNISITDPLPGITIEGDLIPELEPLETDDITFTGTYVITQEDIDNGEVINQAVVTATDLTDAEIDDVSDDPTNSTNLDLNNDGDPDDPTIVVLPQVAGNSNFEIFNGVTPNDDGYNDFFSIKGIDNFPNNNVKIFNRWGVLIWETNGYDEDQNVFTGDADARMMIEGQKDAPTGTYFYVLTFFGNEQGVDYPDRKSYSGYLYLNR